jgi:flagellar hook-length control protein FliK
MSVTIVSTPPTPAPAAAAENAPGKANDDDIAPGQDFASLLRGQRTLVVADVLPKIAGQKDLPETDPAASDAASLLAALGIVAPEPPRTTDTAPATVDADSAVTVDKALPAALPVLKASTSIEQSPKLATKAESVATQPTLSVTVAADDKAAKFAVAAPLATSVEPMIAKSVDTDTAQNNQPTLAISANNAPPNHAVSQSIPTPVRDQNWAADFGQKIVWLATNDKQLAQLTLNPPQMGPIEISLSLDKGNATASFVSANAEVRDAIETAMPRLREMFASAGIALGQTNVSAESFRQQAGNGEGNRPASHWAADNAILVADPLGSARAKGFAVRQGNGMVDIFA